MKENEIELSNRRPIQSWGLPEILLDKLESVKLNVN